MRLRVKERRASAPAADHFEVPHLQAAAKAASCQLRCGAWRGAKCGATQRVGALGLGGKLQLVLGELIHLAVECGQV